ncbi:MAG TPA: complex I NDUFA9 subunit family protein [Casimicrobiaceae bacterium]|nr:complex I NDUFA9 subunit family protein [Casimicrobiaceae bacterium]
MASKRIVVLGGTGFVGRHLTAKLSAAGHGVIVPTRRRERGKALILLPTVDVIERDIHDRRVLDELVKDTDVVVNLVGILHEQARTTFARVHVELARRVVDACERYSVRRLLHMSALGASTNGPSRYLKSKGEAQALVERSSLAWTVFRPSVIFGAGDSFLSLFATLIRFSPVVPLAAPDAKFQPVHVNDVASAMAQCVDNATTVGQRYELCGPTVYTLRELVTRVSEMTGHIRPIVGLPPALSSLQARMLELLPVKLLTRDNLASMRVDNVCPGPFPEVFRIRPAALEAIAPEYLAPRAGRTRYDDFRARSGR